MNIVIWVPVGAAFVAALVCLFAPAPTDGIVRVVHRVPKHGI